MFFTDFIASLILPNKVSNAERVYSIVLRDFFLRAGHRVEIKDFLRVASGGSVEQSKLGCRRFGDHLCVQRQLL